MRLIKKHNRSSKARIKKKFWLKIMRLQVFRLSKNDYILINIFFNLIS